MDRDEREANVTRRRVLGLFGGLGAAAVVVACGDDGPASTAPGPSTTAPGPSTTAAPAGSTGASTIVSTTSVAPGQATTSAAAAAVSCSRIPEETAGPFPGDGTNGPNVLTTNGVVRRDIRASFGGASLVATGVPLTVTLQVLDKTSCAPLAGAAVYAWHCDRDGRYSLYSQGVTGENFLRGVQVAGADGTVAFDTIFPGAYPGRWPHIHFEIFATQAQATTGRNKKATSQLALPEGTCTAVYATSGYETSAKNFPRTTLRSDNVFRDGWDLQTPTVSGDPTKGYTATLLVGV
jgi:protocatechuate 3,4-dioxygenase beta subunit